MAFNFFRSFFTKSRDSFTPISSEIESLSHNTTLLIKTADRGYGFAALVAPDVILSATHNFYFSNPEDAIAIRPHGKEISKIKNHFYSATSDICFLQLEKPMQAPFGNINTSPKAEINMPVLYSYLWKRGENERKRKSYIQNRKFDKLTGAGYVIFPEIAVSSYDGKRFLGKRLSIAFDLIAEKGNSGAPIFGADGNILTIITGSNESTVSGPIPKELAKAWREFKDKDFE
ncbi:MAG: hypothetical protein ACT4OY_07615 [Alphaproteobacteria bacterium]